MRLGICASRQGLAQLEPLLALGELEAVAVPAQLLLPNRPELIHGAEGHRPMLEQHWPQLELLVGAMAAGALIRLLAPLLQDKEQDPAVLLLSGDGQQLIPLLGGHRAGGEQFAQRLAALLGNAVITTGLSSSQGRVPLDSFGEGWGWRRGQGNWDQLMKQAARDEPLALVNEGGQSLALADLAVTQLRAGPGEANPSKTTAPADLWISPRQGPGCRWHPPLLWVGVGCERHSSETLMASALDSALGLGGLAPGAVAGLASLSLKGDEPALLALASKNNWPLRLFEAAALAAIPVPNPSAVVAAEVGTASVAEAAALAAAGPGAELLVAKTIRRGAPGEGAVTVAIALAPSPWAPPAGQPRADRRRARLPGPAHRRRPGRPRPGPGVGGLQPLPRSARTAAAARPGPGGGPTHPGTPALPTGPGLGPAGHWRGADLQRRKRHVWHGRPCPGGMAGLAGAGTAQLYGAPGHLCLPNGSGPPRGTTDA